MITNDLTKTLSKLTILYIEDDDNIRKNFCEFFKLFQANIICTSNAEDGLIYFKNEKPDILIVDINLPNLSGIEFITNIRKQNNTARVIITTAYTDQEFMLKAIELDISRYIVKPVTKNNLIPALKKALSELQEHDDQFSNINLGKNLFFDEKRKQLIQNGIEIRLRKKEVLLLDFLIQNRDITVTYEMLENQLWDYYMSPDAIRAQIKNLRKKTYQNLVKNIVGIGYKLNIEK